MSDNLPQTSSSGSSSFKRVLVIMIVTVLACVVAVSIYMPKMIAWYAEPPTAVGVSCAPSIRWALDKLQVTQLYAMIVGVVLGLLIGFRFRRKA
jgi:hypothetical protein